MKGRPNWADWLYYDDSSPSCLRWKVDRCGGRLHRTVVMAAGDVAGTKRKDGTAWAVRFEGKQYLAHIIVWELHNGAVPEGLIVEHTRGDALDNRIQWLRVTTQAVNTRNRKLNKNNHSGVSGVNRKITSTGKPYWYARCTLLDGKKQEKCFLVTNYGSEEAAKAAAIKKREEMIEELNAQGAGYTARHGHKEG